MDKRSLLNLELPSSAPKRRYSGKDLSIRSFGAAKMTKQTMDWAFDPLSRDQKVFQALKPLRFRSRQLADNDSTMTRFLSLCVTNMVGPTGVRMQPKVKLQRGDKLNDTLNAQIQAEWHLWGRRGNCTVDGRYSWHSIERLFVRTVAMDGEALFLKNVTDNPWGFALQMLDADQLDPTYFEKWNGSREIRMGVEVDKFRRPLGYWLYSGNPSEIGAGPQVRYRFDANGVIHAGLPDSARQTRFIPWASPAMSNMNMLRGYMEAEMIAARVGAAVMGFIRKPAPEGDSPVESLDDSEEKAARTDAEEIEPTPGGFHTLYDGEDITTFNASHPAAAFGPFVKECKRDISTALQVSYTSLFDDLSEVNFSSIRAGLLLERDMWRVRQKWMVEEFHQPVFRAWLVSAVLAGRIKMSVSDVDSVCAQIEWHPRGWDWVDPLKDEQATALAVQNLTTTATRVAASKGLDLAELVRERKAELAMFKEAGIIVGTDNKGDATTASDDQGAGSDSGGKSKGKSDD